MVPCCVVSVAAGAGARTGELMGDCSSSSVAGCCLSASMRKKASPACPSFIFQSHSLPLTRMVTSFSRLLSSCSLPKRTWKGVDVKVPSACATTMMSIAPDSVAALNDSASDTLE